MVFRPSYPSIGAARKKRARTPGRHQVASKQAGGSGCAPASAPTGPAVKTSTPRLSPRGADRAVGGLRTRAENSGRRASCPSTILPLRGACQPIPKCVAMTVRPGPRRYLSGTPSSRQRHQSGIARGKRNRAIGAKQREWRTPPSQARVRAGREVRGKVAGRRAAEALCNRDTAGNQRTAPRVGCLCREVGGERTRLSVFGCVLGQHAGSPAPPHPPPGSGQLL